MRDGTIQPKVLDFGISKAPYSPIRDLGRGILGSPSYFAPEQVHDPKAISPASDQYALGVILYECVTGRLPYEGTNLAAIFQGIVTGNYRAPREHRPDLPDDFQRGDQPRDEPRARRSVFRSAADGAGAARVRVAADAAPVARSFQRGGHDRAATDGESIAGAGHGSDAGPGALAAVEHRVHRRRAAARRDGRAGCAGAAGSCPFGRRCHHRRIRCSKSHGDFIPRAGRSAPADWPRRRCSIAVLASHGRPRTPPAIEPPARPAAAAPEGRAAPDVAQPEPIDELRPASSTHPVREARTAHRPRFGTNKSPLIE